MSIRYQDIILTLIGFLFINSIQAEEKNPPKEVKGIQIEGKIKDAESREILIGAFVTIKNLNISGASNLEGEYKIKGLNPGTYQLVCQYLGYKSMEKEVTLKEGQREADVNFDLIPLFSELKEIVIKDSAFNTESDLFARRTETAAPSVINSVSAKAIQISPDLTVANVLQRVSGISIERSNTGDGQYAIIRGMDKRYNYTLVNGIKIPSPDNKNRYVPMDMFPAELIERLDVIKALTPNMEGDAIGGAMNMVMKNAPNKFIVTANAATGYSQIFFDRPFIGYNTSVINAKAPSEMNGKDFNANANTNFSRANLDYQNKTAAPNGFFGVSIGNRFFKDKLGIIVAGSSQTSSRGTNSIVILPSAQPNPAPTKESNMLFNYDDIQSRQYSSQLTRQGIHTKLDYKLNTRNNFNLYAVYLRMNEVLSRNIIDTAAGPQRSGVGTGELHQLDRSRVTNQTISNITLQGNHDILSNLKFTWTAVYSLSTSNTPDWAEMERIHGVSLDSNNKQVVTPTTLNKVTHRWMHNSDQDKTGYVNLTYTPRILKRDIELSVGGMYRVKHRENFYNEYSLTPTTSTGTYPVWTNIYDANFIFVGLNKGRGTPTDANNYTSDEKILAYYAQAKFNIIKKLQVTGGVRIEQTDQSYTTAADPKLLVGAYGSKSYQDILPSVHLKYELSKKQFLRFSYFASIARPGFFEIIPYTITGEYFNEIGNPYLKHTQADNIDLRYEFFPKGSDQLLMGVFYKNIVNPIEYGYVQTGTSSQAIQPQNYGTATNYGFEFLYTKYIGSFGIRANYTYTNSSITTTKKLYYRNSKGNLTSDSISQTRPLQGQSAHIGNVSLLYKDSKRGIDAQLALVYTGRRISQLSPFYGMDYWQRAIAQLDFSAEKRLHKRLYVFAKVTNILNSPLIVEVVQPNTFRSGRQMLPIQDSDKSIVVQRDYYYQTYLIGIRYKFE